MALGAWIRRIRRRLVLGADPDELVAVGGLSPTLPTLTLDEAEVMLQGLYEMNRFQLQGGTPGIDADLRAGKVRYDRRDDLEFWQPIKTLRKTRRGDCEDLAAAVAAELTERGIPARPIVYRVRPGLAHAVVELLDPKWRAYPKGAILFGHPVIAPGLIDPSRTGGMGKP